MFIKLLISGSVFVTASEDEFERIKTEKDKSIQIIHFTDLNSIQPIYYNQTYHAVPETGDEKAFELLRTAMKEGNKVAIAKTVMGNSETLLCILSIDDGILIEKMFYADEIKDIPKDFAKPQVNEAELIMAGCGSQYLKACGMIKNRKIV